MMERIAKEVIKEEKITLEVEISLWINEDEEEMAMLNEKYRGISNTTDVLSFPQLEEEELQTIKVDGEEVSEDESGKNENHERDVSFTEDESIPLGDIIICLPKVKEQAFNYGHTENRELAFLFLHGLLHLLGYDHGEEKEKKLMNEKQQKILAEIGIDR